MIWNQLWHFCQFISLIQENNLLMWAPQDCKDQYETFPPLLATMHTKPPTENEREPMSLAMKRLIARQNKRNLVWENKKEKVRAKERTKGQNHTKQEEGKPWTGQPSWNFRLGSPPLYGLGNFRVKWSHSESSQKGSPLEKSSNYFYKWLTKQMMAENSKKTSQT